MKEIHPKILGSFLEFYKNVYSLNLKTRWNDVPHMSAFASQDELEKVGNFESVAGHIWGCQLLSLVIKKTNPSLKKVIDFEDVSDLLTVHDIGEAIRGDISLTSRASSNFDMDKDGEREDYVKIIKDLPEKLQNGLLDLFDEFEGESNEEMKLEVLFARWVDSLQGNLTGQIFGNNLPENSEIIEKVMRIRSVVRSRQLVEGLLRKSEKSGDDHSKAAFEAEMISKENIEMVKELGIQVDFSDLGF